MEVEDEALSSLWEVLPHQEYQGSVAPQGEKLSDSDDGYGIHFADDERRPHSTQTYQDFYFQPEHCGPFMFKW